MILKKHSGLYQDGLEDGRKDGLKEVATKLKENNHTNQFIQEMTGLTYQEIKQL